MVGKAYHESDQEDISFIYGKRKGYYTLVASSSLKIEYISSELYVTLFRLTISDMALHG